MEVRKRRLSLSSEDQHSGKRYYVVLEPEVEVGATDSDSDSIRTMGSAETAIVADTSDTCTKSSASEPELSPASLSEASDLDGSSGSTSSFNGPAFIDVVIDVEDDDQSWADISFNAESDSSRHDPEIPKVDYWTCAHCGCKKNNPVFRYCEKCFQRRKQEGLPRPKITVRRKRRKSHRTVTRQQSALKLDKPGPSSAGGETSSQETAASSLFSQDSGISTRSDANLCNGCETEQIDAAFYHTTFCHLWGCYNCSKKAWKPRKRCPMCNGQSRVLRLYK